MNQVVHDDRTVSVTSIMTPPPLETARYSDTLQDTVSTMAGKNKSCVIVLDKSNHPTGIITERDIVRRLVFESRDPKNTLVSEIMSSPLISLSDDAFIYDAAVVMSKYRIRRLPIVKDNMLLGIVTSTDLATWLREENIKDSCLYAMARARFLEQGT